MNLPTLAVDFDPATAIISAFEGRDCWLGQLDDCFAEELAYRAMLSQGDQVVYSLTKIDMASGEGQFHYGLGILRPEKVASDDYQRPSQGE